MKKIYIILLAIPILAIMVLRPSIWSFAGGIGALMILVAFQLYISRLKSLQARNELLENDIEELNMRLEQSVLKEQRNGKELEHIREMKQQLLSVISHEIRTPMNGIMGTALLMQETPLTKEQEDYLTTIRQCSESLLTTVNNILVNDLLDISKIQQEGNQLEYKDLDLRDTIEEVLDLFAGKAGSSGIELLYHIDNNAPEQIIGDSKRIRQILMNLVENAVKFTRQGEVFVGVSYIKHNSAGYPPELKFEVRDTGEGIAKEQLKQLFNGVATKKTEKSDAGEGFGLMICKKLVDMMGGVLEATSEEGSGSSFSFTIPITPSLKAVRSHARESEMANLEAKYILVVSANATNRFILCSQLKSWKMNPAEAATAEEALKILSANNTITAVLADVALPGTTGTQFAKMVKEQYPAICTIGMKPAGNEKYSYQEDAYAAVLTKPVRQHLLRDYLLNIFSQSASEKKSAVIEMSQFFAEQYPQRILIAEDNKVNQKIAVKILTSLGYKPDVANNGKEAIEMAGTEKYDIILMDVQMPEMDGLEATRMIRTCFEVQPVIIAMTANVMQGDRDACMQAGMDDYMSKPIELKELLNQLEKWYRAAKDKRKASA